MKKIILSLISGLFLFSQTASAVGVNIGVSGTMGLFGATAKETHSVDSGALAGSTAEDSDPSNPLLILGIQEDVENSDHSAAGIQYIVKLNNHVFFSSVGDPDAAIS